jgi:hypothetical protein
MQLYRATVNTANQSVRYLKQGKTMQAVKTWERTITYIEEFNKRSNISNEKVPYVD